MIHDFITPETAYEFFYKEAAKRPRYIGLLFDTIKEVYKVLFTPPKENNYVVVKLHGTI